MCVRISYADEPAFPAGQLKKKYSIVNLPVSRFNNQKRSSNVSANVSANVSPNVSANVSPNVSANVSVSVSVSVSASVSATHR